MASSRILASLATAVALTAAAPSLAQAEPSAHAAGGAAGAITYPSLVNERLVRVQAALDRATVYADDHQPDQAAATLMSARTNIRKAWTSAQYIIENTPPPVATDSAFHAQAFTRSGRLRIRHLPGNAHTRARARAAGDAAAGGATIYDTAFAVLSLQHRMATIATGLIDTAHSTLLSSLSTTVFTALNGRDTAIAYIHSIDTPPPPETDSVVVRAHAAGAPVVAGWASVMPGLIPLLDDELQQQQGTLADTTLRAGTRKVLTDAVAQDTATEATVNQFWPPAPVGD
jgi:hypothetical protein